MHACKTIRSAVALAGLALLLAAPPAVMAQGAAPLPATSKAPVSKVPDLDDLDELDEAKVKATKLWQMREKMIALEEQYYALYNELNKDKDFDVHCANEAPLGTRLKKRVCRIQYYEDAQAEEAQALLDGHSVPPASLVLLTRYPEFTKNMLGVLNSTPRLRQLARERDELEKRYNEERKRRFKGKWILFE